MTYAAIAHLAEQRGLIVMGALNAQHTPADTPVGTTILLGTGPDFWPVFTAAQEYTDGAPHPVDRWSKRVVTEIAHTFEATCSFPSDGPPYPPFIAWALASGRFFESPVGMMVHDTVGMMLSLRGALHLGAEIPLPAVSAPSPCETCPAPCTTACPVEALSASAPYNLISCHDFLDTRAGDTCMARGCIARRACPLSAGAGRTDAQSALHMKAFHP